MEARYDLIPKAALEQVAQAFGFGAAKHASDDFTKADSGRGVEGELNAALRHIMRHDAGDLADHETGLHPLAHAAARCLIALELALNKGE